MEYHCLSNHRCNVRAISKRHFFLIKSSLESKIIFSDSLNRIRYNSIPSTNQFIHQFSFFIRIPSFYFLNIKIFLLFKFIQNRRYLILQEIKFLCMPLLNPLQSRLISFCFYILIPSLIIQLSQSLNLFFVFMRSIITTIAYIIIAYSFFLTTTSNLLFRSRIAFVLEGFCDGNVVLKLSL